MVVNENDKETEVVNFEAEFKKILKKFFFSSFTRISYCAVHAA